MTIQPAPPPTGNASKTSTSSSMSLSLPPAVYAKLSPRAFLAAHLPSSRPSGRTSSQFRAPTLHTGSLTHAHGSAVVRIGDTAVVCGIRGEILKAEDVSVATSRLSSERRDGDIIGDLSLLVPNIELATGCNPAYLPGQAPSTLAQSLSQRLLTLLRVTDLVGLEELEIWDQETLTKGADEEMEDYEDEDEKEEVQEDKIMAYWTLYIDILVISLDGAAFDAAWLALLAALKSTRLPAARWDRDLENVLCDHRPTNTIGLQVRGLPVPLSFAIFKPKAKPGQDFEESTTLADPDDFEEVCCDEDGAVTVDEAGSKLCRIEFAGGGLMDFKDLKSLVGRASERWKEWAVVLQKISS